MKSLKNTVAQTKRGLFFSPITPWKQVALLHDVIQGPKILYLVALRPPQNLTSSVWSKLFNPKEEGKSSRGYAASFED